MKSLASSIVIIIKHVLQVLFGFNSRQKRAAFLIGPLARAVFKTFRALLMRKYSLSVGDGMPWGLVMNLNWGDTRPIMGGVSMIFN